METNQSIKLVKEHIYQNATYLMDVLMDTEDMHYTDIENLYYDTDLLYKDHGFDSPEQMREDGSDFKEIFEWYIVSEKLLFHLKDHNEAYISNDLGNYWGRTCTGQAISLDENIIQIANNLYGSSNETSGQGEK